MKEGWYRPQEGDTIQTSGETIHLTDSGFGSLELAAPQTVYAQASRESQINGQRKTGETVLFFDILDIAGERWLLTAEGWLLADGNSQPSEGEWTRYEAAVGPLDKNGQTFYHLTSAMAYSLSLEGVEGCTVIVDDGSHNWFVNWWEEVKGLA